MKSRFTILPELDASIISSVIAAKSRASARSVFHRAEGWLSREGKRSAMRIIKKKGA